VGCAVLNSPFAGAADSGWYGGFNVGQSRAKIDDSRILSNPGSGFTSVSDDDRDTGYKVFGGLRLNRNLALEAGYFNLGTFSFTTTPAGTLDGKIKVQGLNFDAVGILPIAPKFSAFGRIGLQYAQSKDTFSGTSAANSSASKSAVNYKAGAGVQYDFTPTLGMRGEWERYRINDAVGSRGDMDLLSVGLIFVFGGG
jgi:OOP family OmpA-OmpF porin